MSDLWVQDIYNEVKEMDWQTQESEKDKIIAAQVQKIAELTEKIEKIKVLSEDIIADSYEKENQLKARTSELTEYMNQNAELRSQVEQAGQAGAGPDVAKRIQAMQEEKGFLEGLVKQVEDEKLELRQEFESKTALIQTENENLKKSLSELETRIGGTSELEQKILVAKKNNEMLLTEKRNLQKQVIEYEHKSQQWENLDEAVGSLEKRVQELEDEKAGYQSKIRNSEEKIQELAKYQEMYGSLEEEREKLIEEHESKLKETESELSSKITSLKAERTELTGKVDDLESETKTQSKKLDDLKDFETTTSKLQSTIADQESQIQTLQDQVKLLDSTTMRAEMLQKAKQVLLDENTDLQQKVSELSGCKTDLDELKEKHAEVVETLEKYQGKSSRVMEMENQTKNLIDLNTQLEAQLRALQTGETGSSESLIDLQQKNKELNEMNVRILKENSALKDQLEKKGVSLEELKKEASSDIKKEIADSKGALKKQTALAEDQTRQIAGLTEFNRTLQNENSELKHDIRKLKKELTEIAEIKSGFESLKEINFKLEDEKDALAKDLNKLKREMIDLTETAENFKKLRDTYQTLEKTHRELEKSSLSLKMQLKEMSSLKDGFESLKKINTELEDENRDIKRKFANTENELKRFKSAGFEGIVKDQAVKVQELQDSLKFKKNEMAVKDQQLEKLSTMEKDYQQAMSAKNELEVKMSTLELRLGKVTELEAKLNNLQDTRTNLMQDKSRLEDEERNYKAKISQLERQLAEIDVYRQKQKQAEEENLALKSKIKRLTLQLESK